MAAQAEHEARTANPLDRPQQGPAPTATTSYGRYVGHNSAHMRQPSHVMADFRLLIGRNAGRLREPPPVVADSRVSHLPNTFGAACRAQGRARVRPGVDHRFAHPSPSPNPSPSPLPFTLPLPLPLPLPNGGARAAPRRVGGRNDDSARPPCGWSCGSARAAGDPAAEFAFRGRGLSRPRATPGRRDRESSAAAPDHWTADAPGGRRVRLARGRGTSWSRNPPT